MTINQANIYHDLNSLSELRHKAATNSPDALKAVAKQFEGIFIKMMMKSMRDATFGDDLMGSENVKFYQQMYDDQLSLEFSKRGSLGLADILVNQLSGSQLGQQSGKPANQDGKQTENTFLASIDSQRRYYGQPAGAAAVVTNKPQVEPETDLSSGDPQHFLESLWPKAEKAAAKLGVPTEVVLAQAALETGWGRHVIQDKSGRNSHNLFNIKADHRWPGEAIGKSTTEYYGQGPVREQATFRAYDSYQHSFDDYVTFLQSSERYQNALKQAQNGHAFVQELQQAGYATDPHYAAKVKRILSYDVFEKVRAAKQVSQLENNAGKLALADE